FDVSAGAGDIPGHRSSSYGKAVVGCLAEHRNPMRLRDVDAASLDAGALGTARRPVLSSEIRSFLLLGEFVLGWSGRRHRRRTPVRSAAAPHAQTTGVTGDHHRASAHDPGEQPALRGIHLCCSFYGVAAGLDRPKADVESAIRKTGSGSGGAGADLGLMLHAVLQLALYGPSHADALHAEPGDVSHLETVPLAKT